MSRRSVAVKTPIEKNERVESARQLNNTLERQADELRNQIVVLRAEIKQKEKEYSSVNDGYCSISEQKNSLDIQIKLLSDSLSEINQKISSQKGEFSKLRDEYLIQRNFITNEIKKLYDNFDKEKGVVDGRVARLADVLSELSYKKTALEYSIVTVQDRMTILNDAIDKKNIELRSIQKNIANEQDRVGNLKNVAMDNLAEVNNTSTKRDALQQEIKLLDDAIAKKNDELKRLWVTIENEKSKINELKNTVLGLVRREEKVKTMVEKVTELYKRAGLDISSQFNG